ncbi:PD40 domain-containing protein [Hufsiella ginkgonis]|uniref:Uncharacterized protein n=1 Tax=Hufsiella ginkgonis TaxID=2695274 RepID=A0A7K1Y1A7_9SPHI|nr:PD40 domain-containing protein [Hufsiella ginkgonis]MXV17035.1 hypothetical protein [Hufsiella ginkgonis]
MLRKPLFDRLFFAAAAIFWAYAGRGQAAYDFPGGAAGEVAALFAPGIISDGLNNRDFTLSPDGKTVYFSSGRPVDTRDSTRDFDIGK